MPVNKTVTLDAKLDASKDALQISYVVRNLRAAKIYLFNVLFDSDVQGNRTLDPELAYVIPSANGSIVVGKLLAPIPPGKKVESAEMPYLDPVEPGQALAGKISLHLPLHAFQPYEPPGESELDLRGKRLVLQIGFIDSSRAAPREALIEASKGAGAGHFHCDYGLGLKYQEVLTQELAVPAAR